MLHLDILLANCKVQFVKLLVLRDDLGALHVQADWQDTAEREIRVLDVSAIHLLVPVEQVRILELLDGLVRNLGHPIIDTQTSIFEDDLLQIVELVAVIVVRLEVLNELAQMMLRVHDFLWLRQVQRLDHHLGRRALLDDEQVQNVRFVDLANHLRDLDVGVHVLPATTAREIHVAVDAIATLLVQLLVDDVDIFLLEKSLRCLRQLTRVRNCLLAAAHLSVLLSRLGISEA